MNKFRIPEGSRDLIPIDCKKKRKIEKQIEDTFISWGYEEVSTPSLEYYSCLLLNIDDKKSFKHQSLDALARVNSQRKAAKELNIAHTVFNRRLIKAEEKLGFKLSKKSGNRTILTYYGNKLLEEYKKYVCLPPDLKVR